MGKPRAARTILAVALFNGLVLLAPMAAAQNDANSGGDAGNTFGTATLVTPLGLYTGLLAGGTGDPSDYYRFPVALGESINIEIRGVFVTGGVPAPDNFQRLSFQLLDPNGVVLDSPVTIQGDSRVTWIAGIPGDYRFLVTRQLGGFTGSYAFCFLKPTGPHPCPELGMVPIDIIFGGSLSRALTRVLLVPPTHGDLGNPLGPTALDYQNAVLSGIREWERVLGEFADDHPQYSYLDQIHIEVAIYDGAAALTDFDVVITFVESGGTQFRGVATDLGFTRFIALSLFSVSSRAGQTVPDYPEVNDLEAVTKHEFAHTFGLGHTRTWTTTFGPDLMSSPAPFVYGDGSAVGDGGLHDAKKCISTLDLYGMSQLYQWLIGLPGATGGSVSLPGNIPYTWYC